jgi:hypothetical protein
VSRQAFRTFVQHSLARYPGLLTLSFDLRVPDARREAYEQPSGARALPTFRSWSKPRKVSWSEAARHPEYIAVNFIEPRAGNEGVVRL